MLAAVSMMQSTDDELTVTGDGDGGTTTIAQQEVNAYLSPIYFRVLLDNLPRLGFQNLLQDPQSSK